MQKTNVFLLPAILCSCFILILSGWGNRVFAQNCSTTHSLVTTNHTSLICRDQSITQVSFTYNQITGGDYMFLITNQNGLIIEVFANGSYDFNELPADQYLVYGVHYQGELNAEPGAFINQISATICLTLSTNSLPVQVREMSLKTQIISDYNGFAVSKHDASDGIAKVEVEKESGNFLYEWDTHPPQYTQTVTGLEGGVYTVKVQDALGCESTTDIEIDEPTAVKSEIQLVNKISCQGANDGNLAVIANGGVAPYTYSWHHQNTTQSTLNGLKAGVYRATVTDLNGAEKTVSFTLTDPQPLTTQANIFHNDCPGAENGMISMEVMGGMGPYQCLWSNGETGSEIFGLNGGEYEVKIIDQNQCMQTKTYLVEEPTPLTISAQTTPDNGRKTGMIRLNPEGGNAPYQFEWAHGDSTETISGIEAGEYPVSIIDSLGCKAQFTVEVGAINSSGCVEIHTGFSPNGDGINETWHLPCITSYPNNEVVVFNRWGQELFAISNYDNSWNGTTNGRPLPDGTYFYLIKLPNATGKQQFKGTVTIIR